MLNIAFDKQACQNIRESLRKEWLETNGHGDYASSTIPCCNTRKYHGLLVANLARPQGRHVLLSALEESVSGGGRTFFLSCRRHPGVYYPRGQEYIVGMTATPWPAFTYKIGNLSVIREILMPHAKQAVCVRYRIGGEPLASPVSLRLVIRPLLAFRHFHALTRENPVARLTVSPIEQGIGIRPYDALPPLFMQVSPRADFVAEPDWCRNVRYIVEAERGFDAEEDLLQPGAFDIPVTQGMEVYVSASTAELSGSPEDLWRKEASRRASLDRKLRRAMPRQSGLLTHLAEKTADFLIATPQREPAVLAGYHWFDAWGRDTCIALPGLSLFAGNAREGVRQLRALGDAAKDGVIPNCFAPDGNHAYNSVDASLWYVWTVQQFDRCGGCPDMIRDVCWPVIKSIVHAFFANPMPTVFVDYEGLLHAGNEATQLTWMDASVNGRPVTPRHGCPVEINALWYNALAYAEELARRYDEASPRPVEIEEGCVRGLRDAFNRHFWLTGREYLADVWDYGHRDDSLRPNQIFAVSLPHPVLLEERWPRVVNRMRRNLLTPFGLRTLDPSHPDYRTVYFGRGEARDSAYHQGTVWPWLLGAYGDALLKTSEQPRAAAADLLAFLTPLFAKHMARAGLGSISEVFDASPPHYPNGCVAQAWSVAECLRLLNLLDRAAPDAFAAWEAAHFDQQSSLGEQPKVRTHL